MRTDLSQEPLAERCLSILLVEDDVLIRLSAAEMLRDSRYKVTEAADADEAMSLLKGGLVPDLIISDIRMPGRLDGVGLAAAVIECGWRIPILLVSSHLPQEGGIPSGVRFLPKPYGGPQLLCVVRELVAGEQSA